MAKVPLCRFSQRCGFSDATEEPDKNRRERAT